MNTCYCVLAALVLATGTASAQMDLQSDGVGIYFDTGATINCVQPAPNTMLTAYLIATQLSGGGMSGWDATVLINPTTFAAGITFDLGPGALNVFEPVNFHVGYDPLRYGNNIVLLTISTFYLGGQILFGVGPAVPGPVAGQGPDYACPDYDRTIVRLTAASNVPWTLPIYSGSTTSLPENGPPNSFVVAGVNAGHCPVEREEVSWGGVKKLYE